MPSRKRMGKVSYPAKTEAGANSGAPGKKSAAPQLQHQDSLRADIEAARELMSSPESGKTTAGSTSLLSATSTRTAATTEPSSEGGGEDEEDGLDIADALLAALDARDEAETQVQKATAAATDSAQHGKRVLLSGGIKKKSKAQAKKEKREAEEEAMRVQAREELKANGGQPDLAAVEKRGIGELCEVLNAEMYEINPDGHCLYAAVADQLGVRKSRPTDYKSARQAAASYMRANPNEFIPFIADEDVVTGAKEQVGSSNDSKSPEEHFNEYCSAIENTGVWGGQPEILALSHAYEVPIHVVQVGLPILKIGQDDYGTANPTPLVISYHRHMYGLGEHYNSLRPR
ncbi:OTU protein [Tilletia horrida]|nr:OTU protein [Tilletia horrida]